MFSNTQYKFLIDVIVIIIVLLGIFIGYLYVNNYLTRKQAYIPTCNDVSVVSYIITNNGRSNMGVLEKEFWNKAIFSSAQKYNISPVIFASLVSEESKFTGHLVSYKGAVGAAQVMPAWTINQGAPEDCKKINLQNIENNLLCGAAIIRYELDKSKDLVTALRFYVAGPRGEKYAAWYAENILMRANSAIVAVCPGKSNR